MKLSTLFTVVVALMLCIDFTVAQHSFSCGVSAASVEDDEQRYLQMQNDSKAFYEWKKSNKYRRAGESEIIIPVHVIIVHDPADDEGENTNLSEYTILEQIEVLNKAFSGENMSFNDTPEEFSKGTSCISFCLASKDPEGNPTKGITRYASALQFDNNERQIVEQTMWPRDTYLNLYVAENLRGNLGYAIRPTLDSLPPSNSDAAMILTTVFGGPGTATFETYDLGIVAIHEVGHWLGLNHVWAEYPYDGCDRDDFIDDTPLQGQPNFGCPDHPSPSCGNDGDMFMNYMDYTDDVCKTAFTQDQCDYMEFILREVRTTLLDAAEKACSPGIPRLIAQSKVDPICPNSATGLIQLKVYGGTAPFQFKLNGSLPQSNNIFEGLVEGAYVGELIDSSGVTVFTDTVFLQDPVEFELEIEVLEGSCEGLSQGAISLSATGGNLGIAEYKYANSNEVLGYTQKDTTLNEDLENGFPANWTLQSYWRIADSEDASSLYFDIPKRENILVYNDDTLGFFNTWEGGVYSSVIDLGESQGCIVEFDAFFLDIDFWNSDETARFLISADNGSTYQEIVNLQGNVDWVTHSYDFENLGSSRIILRFEYDDGGGANGGFAIDNIRVLNKNPLIIEDLSPGEYFFTAVGPLGCTAENSIVVPELEVVNISSLDILSPTCVESGQVTIDANSVNGIKEYVLGSDSNPNGQFEDVPPGEFLLQVTDNLGCIYTDTLDLVIEKDLSISLLNFVDIICQDDFGSFSVDHSGGTGSITYSLNGEEVSGVNFEDLSPGNYQLVALDELGCSDTIFVDLVRPEPLFPWDGEIDSAAVCVNSTFGYSLSLDVADKFESIIIKNSDEEEIPSTLIEGFLSFELVPVDTYLFEAIDSNGCNYKQIFEITALPAPEIQLINLMPATNNMGGTIEVVSETGSSPYQYLLAPTGERNTTGLFENLELGAYGVYSLDANGCVSDTLEFVIEMNTGIMDLVDSELISVFPVPASTFLNIIHREGKAIDKIKIYGTGGKAFVNQNLVNNQLDIENLTNGVYILEVSIGGKIEYIRFVKS